jgi:hypothetical protein
MGMPPQLRNAHRPRPGKSRKPLFNELPTIRVTDLPKSYETISVPPKRWTGLIDRIRVSNAAAEFTLNSHAVFPRGRGTVSQFRFKYSPLTLGLYRSFICCWCNQPATKLYIHHGRIACRHCTGGRYFTQALSQSNRRIYQAFNIVDFITKRGGLRKRTVARLWDRAEIILARSQGRMGTQARRRD